MQLQTDAIFSQTEQVYSYRWIFFNIYMWFNYVFENIDVW